jgi:hypothetical protein
MTVILAIIALFVAAAVVWRLVRPPRENPIDEALPLLHALALMVDGSFLVIEDRRSGRFIQFLKQRGDGLEACLLFDLPNREHNAAVFEQAVRHLRARGFEPRMEIEPGDGEDPPLETLQIDMVGAPEEVAARALDLAKAALAGLDADQPGYVMTLEGDPDQDARTRAAAEGLRTTAEMGIPILSRVARRLLENLPENRGATRAP